MHPSARTAPLLGQLAEIAVIAAWLAVPLFAMLAAGRMAPPLHAAAIATLLTLALRGWRAAQRGQPLDATRNGLAAYLVARTRPTLTLRRHHRPLLRGSAAGPTLGRHPPP